MIVATPKGKLEIITNLVGRHNVYNVLAAVAVGLLLGLELADIGAGVEAVQVIPGRCEVVNNVLDLPLEGEDAEGLQQQQPNLPRDFPVVVDAADTPQRLAAVLDALREAGAERIFTVFGCDGVVSGNFSTAACLVIAGVQLGAWDC
jgi:UDP-N-acetylmuramyl tripeptide synthase